MNKSHSATTARRSAPPTSLAFVAATLLENNTALGHFYSQQNGPVLAVRASPRHPLGFGSVALFQKRFFAILSDVALDHFLYRPQVILHALGRYARNEKNPQRQIQRFGRRGHIPERYLNSSRAIKHFHHIKCIVAYAGLCRKQQDIFADFLIVDFGCFQKINRYL